MLKHCWIALDSSEKHSGHSGLTASITRKRQWRHKMSPKTRWKTSRITSFKNKGNFCTDWCEIAASKAGLISRRVAQVQTVLDKSCFALAEGENASIQWTYHCGYWMFYWMFYWMVWFTWFIPHEIQQLRTKVHSRYTLYVPAQNQRIASVTTALFMSFWDIVGHVKPRDSRRIQAPHQPVITIFNNYIKAQLNGAKADVLHLAQAS